MRILVADDDEYIRNLLAMMVHSLGHEAVVCADGSEVLALVDSGNTPQILLLDWMMPGTSGIQIIKRLREILQTPYCYTILLTARDQREDVVAGLRAGANDYITKPFRVETVENRLRIAIQTVDMHNDMLQQRAEVLAAARLSTLGEMAAGIAHEIRNPLTIIHGQAVMLQTHLRERRLDRERIDDATKKIVSTTLRISEIISGLLQFAGRGAREPAQEVLATDLLERALTLCGAQLRSRGIELRTDGISESMTVFCQPVLMTQVLVNLLINAMQAIELLPDRWIAVNAWKDERHFYFSVSDSGKGIPVEFRPRLMQPFFTTKPPGKGVGLGLSIASGIMTSHGGGLRLDDAHPHTRFVLWLPLENLNESLGS